MKSLELEYNIGSLYLWTVKLPENCNSLETITIEFPPSLRLLMKHNAHILSNVKTLELFEDLIFVGGIELHRKHGDFHSPLFLSQSHIGLPLVAFA